MVPAASMAMFSGPALTRTVAVAVPVAVLVTEAVLPRLAQAAVPLVCRTALGWPAQRDT